MPLIAKLTENVFNNFYTIHPKGKELFDMDIQETLDHRCDSLICTEKEISVELRIEIQELKTKVNDLESENAILVNKHTP